jgi:GAF domain-containing protein
VTTIDLIMPISAANDSTRARRPAGRTRVPLEYVAEVLSQSLDYHLTQQAVTSLVVPRLADWCMLFVADDGESLTPRLMVAHGNPGRERALQSLWQHQPTEMPATHPIAQSIRTAAPVLIPHATGDDVRSVAYAEDDVPALNRIGLRTMLVLPLMAHGFVLGAIMLVGARQNGRPFDEADLEPMKKLASLCARALYNARLYREAKLAMRMRDELIGAVATDLLDRLAQTRASLDLLRWQVTEPAANRRDLAPRLRATEALVSEMEDLVRGLRGVSEQEMRNLSR